MALRFVFGAVLALGLSFVTAETNWAEAGRVWWKHVEYLASDDLQGRAVGSAGFDRGADYVADQFQRAGLVPAGTDKYFQPVELRQTALNLQKSQLYLVREGNRTEVPAPGEAMLGFSAHAASVIDAPLVFTGYGLKIPEADYDDLKGLPLQSAIAVYLSGGPSSIDGNLRSHYSSAEERWKAFQKAGAVGMISIPNPRSMEIPWSRQAASFGRPRIALADPMMESAPGLLFSASWNPEKADDLLAGSGHSISEILSAADSQTALPHFELPSTIKAYVSVSTEPIRSKNVVGLRMGDDPQLKDEYVVFSAHLDHLGVGNPVKGDGIYNGAMDDASGVASLIEIARSLKAENKRISRSILFVAVTGEESGELGSKFFAERPSVQGRIVADLNMDMFLPLFPLKWLEVQGVNESTLGDDIRAVAEGYGVQVQADKQPERNRFIRSDQYSFIKMGVPALAFKFGYISGGPEEKIFQDWYTNRYHGVSDDVHQPVDLEAAARFNAILTELGIRLSNEEKIPSWKETSFFKRFAK